jgi:hypothetical protein
MLSRIVRAAWSEVSPIAVNTGEGVGLSVWQALPAENATPGAAAINSSAVMPGKVRLRLPGSR